MAMLTPTTHRIRHFVKPGTSSRRLTAVRVKCALPAAEPGKTKLGFAGLGIMGQAMSKRLIDAGYELHVWNRDPAKAQLLATQGAKVASTPKELASRADITFAMLSDPPAALAVATGKDGITAGLGPGKGYVDVSTVDSATSSSIASAVRATGAHFLEAPVSGSKGPAINGQLIFLTAGDEALFTASAHPLSVMGKKSFFLGEVGAGANMKLVVNMIMGSTMAAFAEGLTLADKADLKQQDVLDVLGLGAIATPMFALKGPTMIQGNFAPAFPLKHQQKDLRLALLLGDEAALSLPVAAAANNLYIKARSEDLGDLDFSAVLKVIQDSQQQK